MSPANADKPYLPSSKNWLAFLLPTLSMVGAFALFFFLEVPSANWIMVVLMVGFTAVYGYGPGGIALGIALLFNLERLFHGSPWGYQSSYFPTFLITFFSATLLYLLIGNLHHRRGKYNATLERANRSLRDLSATDALTHAKNRLAFREDFDSFLGKDVFVAMLDIDDFKAINDAHGHPTGDHVLRKVSRALMRCYGVECCYRYGGDEFLLVFPGNDEKGFLSRLEEAESLIEAPATTYVYEDLSISVGFVQGNVEDEASLRGMIEAADRNLYRCKQEGKGRHYGGSFRPNPA